MADIEKIFYEELEKAKPQLVNSKNIYWKGTNQFNQVLKNKVFVAHKNSFKGKIEDLLKNCEFLIVKDDVRYQNSYECITCFFPDGISFLPLQTSFWNGYSPYWDYLKNNYTQINGDRFQNFVFKKIISMEPISNEDLIIDFELENDQNIFHFHPLLIFPVRENQAIRNNLMNFLKNVFERAFNEDKEYDLLCEEYDEAYNDDDWQKALSIIDKLIKIKPDYYWNYFNKAWVLYFLDNWLEAEKILKVAFDKFYKVNGFKDNSDKWSDYVKSKFAFGKIIESYLFEEKNLIIESVKSLNESIRFTKDEEKRANRLRYKDELLDALSEDLINFDYNERKVIYLDGELSFYNPSNILPLEISKTKELKFPAGHPVAGQLYVGHPFVPNLYYPIEDYETSLFESQAMELSSFLKSLGATKIKTERVISSGISSSQSLSADQSLSKSQSGSVAGSGLIYSAEQSGSINRKSFSQSEQDSSSSYLSGKRINIDGEFLPKYKPYIREDLIWYEHNEVWKSIAKQRLEGGLKSYRIVMSTKDVEQVSERELKKIDEEYQQLLKISGSAKVMKASAEMNTSTESSGTTTSLLEQKKKNTTEWQIYVEFAPIEELKEEAPNVASISESSKPLLSQEAGNLSENEQEYFELVEDSMEDGVITEAARRILERRRAKLEISENRALEIEKLALGSLYSETELQYIDEIQFMLEDDGIISEDERKILERKRERLNITEERAKELENNVVKK